MDGGGTPLNRFERVYWIAFGGAVAFIAGSNMYRYFTRKKDVVVRLTSNRGACYVPPIYVFELHHKRVILLRLMKTSQRRKRTWP